jgi:hypothetical protein
MPTEEEMKQLNKLKPTMGYTTQIGGSGTVITRRELTINPPPKPPPRKEKEKDPKKK